MVVFQALLSLLQLRELLDLLFEPFDVQLLFIQLLLILILSICHLLIDFLMLNEVLLCFPLDFICGLRKLGLDFFPPLSLAFVSLFILYYFTLTFVHYLKEKVFHEAHGFLVFFVGLNVDVGVIANTDAFQLLLQSFGILQNILYCS